MLGPGWNEMGRELDLVLVFGEDIDVVNRIVGPGERFLEQIANLGDVFAVSHGEDVVLRFGGLCAHRVTVHPVHQRT